MTKKDNQPLQTGQVIVNFRRQSDIETSDGAVINCITKGRRLQVVCGDYVQWRPLDNDKDTQRGVIEAIEPRKSLLFRYDQRRQQQPLAANLDQMLIVSAPQPLLEPFLIDKYLVAAEAINVTPVIVLNKIDLLEAPEQYDSLLTEYHQLGYATLKVSAEKQTGKSAMTELLANHTSVLVGASGTGKSSLLKSLLPDADVRIGDVVAAREEGRHTTTRTTLYHLPDSGNLIDSPGVRDFMLWPMPVEELRDYFIEFRAYTGECRFNNCNHLHEPGCAIKAAVSNGAISQRRYDSYTGLAKIMQAQYREY